MGISKPNANIAQLLFLVQQKPAKMSTCMCIQLLSKESETLQSSICSPTSACFL